MGTVTVVLAFMVVAVNATSAGERLRDTQHAEKRCYTGLVGSCCCLDNGMGDILGGGDQRGDEAGQDTVDQVVAEGHVKSGRELRGCRLGRQRDRAMGDLQPPADARLGGEGPQCVGVPHDGHPAAAWQRLVDQKLGDIEELMHVLDPDHTRLTQHGVEGGRRHVAGADPVTWRHAIRADPGLDHDHGLAQRKLPRDPGELAWVAHRLQIEADRVGVVVVDPVLHKVVSGDVDPVAGRRKDRDAEIAFGSGREHGDTQRAALGEQTQGAHGRQHRSH